MNELQKLVNMQSSVTAPGDAATATSSEQEGLMMHPDLVKLREEMAAKQGELPEGKA